jgi:predicted nuclease of predicted toxin-antitoxin system
MSALSPLMAGLLRDAGHDCAHIYELGLGGQPDEQVMALANRENRILVSAYTDFGELLANAPVLAPSVILLRRTDKRARSLATVVLANLEQIADDLAAGALIVISDTRIRAATSYEAGRLGDYSAVSLTAPAIWPTARPLPRSFIRTRQSAGMAHTIPEQRAVRRR